MSQRGGEEALSALSDNEEPSPPSADLLPSVTTIDFMKEINTRRPHGQRWPLQIKQVQPGAGFAFIPVLRLFTRVSSVCV